ncbi:MAG: hypothetical protein LBL42_03840 [Tannerella sp.]|jgi:hypothetical protein|nr:hypothetical protein [Tannerella sp.]
MKAEREEKREEKLNKLGNELKIIRKELHGSKQKIRDMEKSRRGDREKLKLQEQAIRLLTEELKKNAEHLLGNAWHTPGKKPEN